MSGPDGVAEGVGQDLAWRPRLIAHRGVPTAFPENTLAGFGQALEDGADILETDLWVTADGVLVCHHDATLDRVTDQKGAIGDLTLARVKQATVLRSEYGAFEGAGQVPTLDELLAFVPADRGLALELKDPRLGEPELAARLAGQIAGRIEAGTVMLLSFQEDLLWAARRADPRVWISRIDEHEPHPWFAGNGIGTVPQAMAENPAYMAEARARDLWVCPLDPAPEPRLDWYSTLEVDALLTDDVARTRRELRERGWLEG
ncbi:MAG: hypothetical protein MUF10_04765 [Thermoanaerobaculaceae bacterium]|nr:hypothetical protein [Thermoanaerobaculaceae bacterium]